MWVSPLYLLPEQPFVSAQRSLKGAFSLGPPGASLHPSAHMSSCPWHLHNHHSAALRWAESAFGLVLVHHCHQQSVADSFAAGLEVRVAFGGVWKDSLTELSGGQRSLLALSLILAMLLFKPAPIYILDEVHLSLSWVIGGQNWSAPQACLPMRTLTCLRRHAEVQGQSRARRGRQSWGAVPR